MKKLINAFVIVLVLSSYHQIFSQHYENNKKFTDFFKIEVLDHKYLLYGVDSMKNDPYYHDLCSSLWAFNNYLLSNYSTIHKKDSIISSFIPDTLEVRKLFSKFINEDSSFKSMFNKVINKDRIPSIHIDSLQKIASRFYFVHRVRGEVAFHLCSVVNETLNLTQNENSPYYNAFCFMTIRNSTNNMDLFERATLPYREELNNSISDERLIEIKNAVFKFLASDTELQENLLREYDMKKPFLNFGIIQ